jgi:protein-S-isoprenylcysteine O-methyltransferase Ste14
MPFMIAIGNFFFTYRNGLFVILYILLFIPSVPLFTPEINGKNYYLYPVIIGLVITVTGQIIRCVTIALAYIIRGGKDRKVYAEDLVTNGIFAHCRNPLYAGNILMLTGVGILSNSLVYVVVVIPVFLFIYHSIVLAEENFLRNKFGDQFNSYCDSVNRWFPSLKGIRKTFKNSRFNWKRYVIKEYNTFFLWLGGITLLLLLNYPQLTHFDKHLRNRLFFIIFPLLILGYLFVRFLKKSGRLRE